MMLTICTACSTRFRVTPKQLRTAHGLVRCSHCHAVFDAFETLTEENGAAPAEKPRHQTTIVLPKSEEAAPEVTAEISAAPTEADIAAVDIRVETAEEKPAAVVEDLFAELEREAEDRDLLGEENAPPGVDEARVSAATDAGYADTTVELPPKDHDLPQIRPRHRFLWSLGGLALLVLLALQLLNANRVALSGNPVIGSSLSAAYRDLGHPLTPPLAPGLWQVNAINVTSDPDTPGALSITGTLANNAAFAQPWPLLRIELTDRYGDLLRARDFNPGEYLPADQANAWLGAGIATHFRLDVVDPGPEAVGFVVEPCFENHGRRHCLAQPGGGA